MSNNTFIKVILLLLVISCMSVSWCRAQTTFIPNAILNLQLNYDNNFYYLPEDEISVTTYLVQPGFEIGLETAKGLLAARYTLDANFYNQSGEDDFYGHSGLLLGEFELTDRLQLDLKDRLVYTRDPAQLEPIGTPASREKYFQNRFAAALSYHFEPKITVKGRYENWITDYRDGDLEDAVGNQGAISLIYHLNRSTAVDLKYQYWAMDYDDTTSDYQSHLLWLKSRKEWRLVSLEAGIGYHERSYDDHKLEDNDTFIYSLELDGASKSGKSRFGLSALQNYNYLGFQNNDYYKAYIFAGKYDYDLTMRITAGVEASYQNNDYVNTRRDDDIYAAAGDIGYLIKEWLELVFSVSYEQRDSKEELKDYDRFIGLVELQFDYDFGKE